MLIEPTDENIDPDEIFVVAKFVIVEIFANRLDVVTSVVTSIPDTYALVFATTVFELIVPDEIFVETKFAIVPFEEYIDADDIKFEDNKIPVEIFVETNLTVSM